MELKQGMPEAKWGGWVRQVRSGTEAGGAGNEGGGGGVRQVRSGTIFLFASYSRLCRMAVMSSTGVSKSAAET